MEKEGRLPLTREHVELAYRNQQSRNLYHIRRGILTQEDLEDAYQNAAVKALDALAYTIAESPDHLLSTIAARSRIDIYRRTTTRNDLTAPMPEGESQPMIDRQSKGTPLEEEVVKRMQIEQALNNMKNKRNGQMVVLFSQGYGYNEIGEKLGVSLGAVRQGILRGRLELRQLLEEDDT